MEAAREWTYDLFVSRAVHEGSTGLPNERVASFIADLSARLEAVLGRPARVFDAPTTLPPGEDFNEAIRHALSRRRR